MVTILGLYLAVLTVGLFGLMLYQHNRHTHDLLSIRNFALLGFVVFQLTSGSLALLNDTWDQYDVESASEVGLIYCAMCTVFLVVLFWTYDKGFLVRRVAHKIPTAKIFPGDAPLWLFAGIFTAIGVTGHIMVRINLISSLASMMGVAFSAIACGIAGWVWARNMVNPVTTALALGFVGVNSVASISGTFGRRPLLAIGACLIWGMYYSRWKYLPSRSLLTRLAIIGAIPVISLALFSSVRSAAEGGRTATEHLQAIQQGGNVSEGLSLLLSGQNTGAKSMWLIDNYPERFEPRPLFILRYFLMYPIPRDWWEEKPWPLSNQIADMAQLRGVRRDQLKVGPGIIGHAAAEGGWYALVIYAAVGGLLFRFLDELVRINPYNPLIVVPIGAAMGHLMGLARGETSTFTFNFLFSVASTWVFCLILAKLFEGQFASISARDHAVLEHAEHDYGEPHHGHPETHEGHA